MEKKKSNFAKWFWRGICGALTLCILVVTTIFLIEYGYSTNFRWSTWKNRNVLCEYMVSPHVQYRLTTKGGYLENKETNKTTLKNLRMVVCSDDTLGVYFMKDKRGYFNRFTGERVTPPLYDKVWVYSEGLSAAVIGDSLYILDRKQQPVAGAFLFTYYDYVTSYVFTNGYAPMVDSQTKLHGIINTQGQWVKEPVYKRLDAPDAYGRRLYCKKEGFGLLDSCLNEVFPQPYAFIELLPDGDILVQDSLNRRSLYAMDGTLKESFLCDNVSRLYYTATEYNAEEHEEVSYRKEANAFVYSVSNRSGLMDVNGKMLTGAVFKDIEALTPDLFCGYYGNHYEDAGVLIDRYGRIVSQSLDKK